jgi:ribonuclease-3
LEFLGDSVLGIVITDALYHRHPELPEGQLAKLRSAVVNARALATVARTLDLGTFIRLGRGEEATGGRDKSSILADTVEALLGATYLDHGIEVSRELILRLFAQLLDDSETLGAGLDWKTSLQELTAELGAGVPSYAISESGPDHAKEFEAQVVLGEKLYGHGRGSNKKEAEQQAAASAYAELQAEYEIAEQQK